MPLSFSEAATRTIAHAAHPGLRIHHSASVAMWPQTRLATIEASRSEPGCIQRSLP